MASFKRTGRNTPSSDDANNPYRIAIPKIEPLRSYHSLGEEELQLIALLKAIEAHDIGQISELLSESKDVNFTIFAVRPLVYAAHLGQLDTVELFAERGANLHLAGKLPLFIMDKVVCFNEFGPSLTPLDAAERAGHESVVEFLKTAISW
ncbi:MAG TPA: hypothetical protein VLD37_02425 [Candidatus Bilamarchaeum sp.]|nr:hypothetical protein [Candidatus Bilamarchaeum sp.]